MHRLIQNQVDGKLIEFGDQDTPLSNSNNNPTTDQSSSTNLSAEKPLDSENGDDTFTIDSVHRYNKKLESLNYEYNRMLASTLDNQRAYFEQRLGELNQEESYIIMAKK